MTCKLPALLRILPLFLLALLASCDQKPAKPAEQAGAQKKKKSLGSPDVRFTEARALIMEGKFDEAAASLAETAEEPKIRPSLLNWIQFHQALALMLADKEKEARPVFAKIEERGLFPKGNTDPEGTEFLVKLSHLMKTADPVSPDVIKDYDKWTFQGIAYLVFGLKDWGLDKFEDSAEFFRQFNDVAPEKQVEWASGPDDLRKLKEIATNFVNDYTAYTPAKKALDEAAEKPLEDQKDAIDQAKAARAKMKLTTKLSKSLDGILAERAPKVVAAVDAKNKATMDEMAADDKALKDGKDKRAELQGKFQFTEAKQAITEPNLKIEKNRDEQDLLSKKTQWLINFKSQLIEDLNKTGYTPPLKKKSGETIAGPVVKADDQQIYVGSKANPKPVPWEEVSLDSDYDMGVSFIPADLPAEMAAFRKWHLGVFAFFAGKTKEGLDLLQSAAKSRAVFKEELPLFENASGPY
jgi:hypothetical protein